jgi:hypothetical protein
LQGDCLALDSYDLMIACQKTAENCLSSLFYLNHKYPSSQSLLPQCGYHALLIVILSFLMNDFVCCEQTARQLLEILELDGHVKVRTILQPSPALPPRLLCYIMQENSATTKPSWTRHYYANVLSASLL